MSITDAVISGNNWTLEYDPIDRLFRATGLNTAQQGGRTVRQSWEHHLEGDGAKFSVVHV